MNPTHAPPAAEHHPYPASGRRTTCLLAVLVALAAGLVYANSLLNGFALDDGSIVATNERVHDLSRLREIWLTPYWPRFGPELGLYRPLAVSLYALQWAAAGGAPWFFHAVNLLLHALATVLVFLLLGRFVPVVAAAAGGLVFAVHPVHTEAVANVVGQAELVATAALVGACLVHATRPQGTFVNWRRRLAVLGLFLVGLFAKESAAVLPALLVLVDLAGRRVDLTRRGVARYADAMAMPLFLLVAGFAVYTILRLDALEGAFMGGDAGPQLWFLKEHRILNALRAFPEFMRLLFFPVQLSADYHPAVILPVESLTPMAGLGLLLLAGLVVLSLITPWRPAVGLPAAWFLVAMSPVANLFFPVGVLVAERTLYLPSVAVATLVAFAWTGLTRGVRGWRRPVPWLLLGAAVLAMGVRTWARNPDWASTPAVLTAVVRDRPESYRAQWTLGATHHSNGDRRAAALNYEAAYRIYPRDSEFLTEYADFLLGGRQFDRAVELLETAYGMHPYVLRTASLLAYAYLAAARPADALPVIRQIEELGATWAFSMPLRAYAWEQLAMPDKSAAAWRVALRQPQMDSWRNWSFLARALATGGHDQEALVAASRARTLVPDSASAGTVERLVAAIGEDCYRPGAEARPGSRAREWEACDPLGDWLRFVGLQSAKVSQNARPVAGPGPGTNREGRR